MTEGSGARGLADRVADGALGSWISIGHPTVVEAAARAGFAFVAVDTEHSTMSLETVAGLVRAAEAAPGDLSVVVRPAWNDPVRIKRVLDIGVDGLMVPMVDTAEDARAFVEATRYPPDGVRGVAGGRASGHGQSFVEYVERDHDDLLRIAQIETPTGVENAGEIAATEGIDSLFVGPADLSASLGVFAEWDSPELAEAIERVLEASHGEDVPVGTLTVRAEDVPAAVERGFDYLIAGKDTTTLIEGGERIRETYERSRSERG
ncbi:HpcH/HpaI aldolase family protein [Natronorarus salvus]|uniref:HpcH/HpaI aldolase family protein n=1 Tax=Natronorarus salvus TaxID=3117733 RepID=UPI002F26D355